MTAESLAAICGVILSLFFSYIPGRESWWAELEAAKKRLVMLFLLILTAVAVFLISCVGWAGDFGIGVECSRPGLVGLVTALIYAVMANQGAYQLTKPG